MTTPVALVEAVSTSVHIAPPSPSPSLELVVAQGPQGPRGPSGAAVSSFVHDQLAPSDVWVVNHDLGMKPNVTVQDSAGTTVFGRITYTSEDQLVLTFSAAFAGRAYLS